MAARSQARSAAVRLELRVRILPGAWLSVFFMIVVSCQVEVSASG